MYEDVPELPRIGLFHIVEQYFKYQGYSALLYSKLYRNICVALRIPRDRSVYDEYAASKAIEGIIRHCNWWQFYDICEVMYTALESDKDEFSAQVNTLFKEERLGFELRDGKVEKVGSGFIDAEIKEARYLLKEPEFKGADEQFEKAIKALNVRPEPDVENCVKDAVGAIESVGRIIINNEKALLSDIIKDMAGKGTIPKPLDQTIQKLYAYRGDQPGVAHGAVGASKVTVDEAEFVLAMSAAMIIYLVKKGKNA
jgi:ABC-type cobalt transport system substrate-binding protein